MIAKILTWLIETCLMFLGLTVIWNVFGLIYALSLSVLLLVLQLMQSYKSFKKEVLGGIRNMSFLPKKVCRDANCPLQGLPVSFFNIHCRECHQGLIWLEQPK